MDSLLKTITGRIGQRMAALGFFLAFFGIGLAIYGDYGVSWDEQTSRDRNGLPNYQFITQMDVNAIRGTCEKYHGPAFEILLLFVEKAFDLEDSRDIYLARHLVTFLLFFSSVLVFYRLLRRRFQSRFNGLIGALFLILSPRIFADAFYNSKDLAFLACFIFCLASLDRFLRHMNYRNALLHALACGFAVDIRNIAMIIPVITVLMVMAQRKINPPFSPWPSNGKPLRVYFAGLCFFIILFWPVLWLNPPYHFYRAWIEMSRFPWPNSVLYRGQIIKASELPWHYIPVWLLITTPLVYTFFFAIGTGRMIGVCLRSGRKMFVERPLDVAMALALLLPPVAVIVLRSVVYDGWRHLYFIYPAFLYIAILGFAQLDRVAIKLAERYRPARAIFLIATTIPLVFVGMTMAQMHPNEFVYFNRLAGPNLQAIKSQYEMDYWGVSCRQGLEFLAKYDPLPRIKVFAATEPGKFNALILPADTRVRIVYTSRVEEADYEVTHFRDSLMEPPADKLLFSVHVGNANIMAVHKVH